MSEPMSVGDCVGASPGITWNGQTYTVGRPTPGVLAAIEGDIARDVWDEAKELDALDPGFKEAVRDKLLARHHRVGGPLWDKTFATAGAQLLQLWALVRANHPAFTREQATELYRDATDECELALILVAPDFFEQVAARANMGRHRAEAKLAEQKGRAAAALAGRG